MELPGQREGEGEKGRIKIEIESQMHMSAVRCPGCGVIVIATIYTMCVGSLCPYVLLNPIKYFAY